MKSILSRSRCRILDQWLRDDTLFAFDYDGTLAPMADRPCQVQMSTRTRAGLARLSTLAPVAVISGRAREDVRTRLPPGVTYVVGNHGNEGLPIDRMASRTVHERCCWGWLNQLRVLQARGADRGELDGLFIEDKGVTLTLHYRQCGDCALAQTIVLGWLDQITPAPHVIDGHLCINLLPGGARNKRQALIQLMVHSACRRAVYVGDDVTDEAVFVGAPSHWLTVHVGAEGGSQARYRVRNVGDVTKLIELAVQLRGNLRVVSGREAFERDRLIHRSSLLGTVAYSFRRL